MGYSTVIAHVVLFMVFLSSLYLLYDTYYGYLDDVGGDSVAQTERLKQKLDTRMSFSSTTYDNGVLELYLTNTGSLSVATQAMDLYIDREWVQENDVSFEIQNKTIDPLLWDPGELLLVNASKTLGNGIHEAKVVASNGVYTSIQFTK